MSPLSSVADARDAEQLSKNKVTHILSVHDSARPMLEVRALVMHLSVRCPWAGQLARQRVLGSDSSVTWLR